MFTIDFTKPWLYKDVSYFNQGNLAANNILRCKVITGGDTSLEDYIGEVTFVTLSRKEINGVCNVIDTKNCIIDIHFPSNALEVGENTLEIILTKGSGSNKVVAQSPAIKYEVWRGITTGNGVASDNNYPVLIALISNVNNVVRIANNASATANASLKQTARMIEDVDNALVKANNTINDTNSAKNEALEAVEDVKKAIAAGTQDLEVKRARGKYAELKDRFDNLDKDLLKAKEITTTLVTAGSNFATVEETNSGYFEGVRLEGKTLVNRFPKLSGINTTSNGFDSWVNMPIMWDNGSTIINCSDKVILVNLNRGSDYVTTLTLQPNTPQFISYGSDVQISQIVGQSNYGWLDSNKTQLQNILVLEGDCRNSYPKSFFEGIASVGEDVDELVVSSCNSNPWDGTFEIGSLDTTTGKENSLGINRKRTPYFSVKGGDNYSIKILDYKDDSSAINLHVYDSNFNFINWGMSVNYYINTSNIVNVIIPKNAKYMRFRTEDNRELKPDSVIISHGEYKGYIKHKSDKKKVLYYDTETQTWKKPILREWDSIEKHNNGKYYYHKRSSERLFNGSEEWYYQPIPSHVKTVRFSHILRAIDNSECICDKFTYKFSDEDFEHVKIGSPESRFFIYLDKTKIPSIDVNSFKTWLQQNPITVVYQLEQEEVYECMPIDLITFENKTNYMIECGAVIPKSSFKYEGNIGNAINTLKEKVSYLEDKLFKTNLANFTVALNTLDTKLRLDRLEAPTK